VKEFRLDGVDRGDERRDALALLEPAEEDEAANAIGDETPLRRSSLGRCVREVRRDDGTGNRPAASPHPVEHVSARRDDHVGELDARALESLELERPNRPTRFALRVVRPAVRSVAVDDDERVLEPEPKFAQLQRRVGRTAPVVRDDDVRPPMLEVLLHGVGQGQAAGLDASSRSVEPLDLDPPGRVLPAPRRVERRRYRGVREEELDVIPQSGERERQKRCCGPCTARADQPE
jgi:hypothetical protein